MKILNFITIGLIIITLSCEIEPDEITLGEIMFAPNQTRDRIYIGEDYIFFSCKTSDGKYVEDYYYTLDGSDPTENSSYWKILSERPEDLYFSDYIKNIKVLAVYNDNGKKLFKTGEANYNFKYLRTFRSSSNLSPFEVQMDKGYYNFGYFSSMHGTSGHSSFYRPSQDGNFNITVSANLDGTINVTKNGTKINTTPSIRYKEIISVNKTDIVRIQISQGSYYQIGGNPNWNFEISLE